MAVVELEELRTMLSGAGRLLGLDPGSKTLGLALSDSRRRIATPLLTIKRGKFSRDAARLLKIIGEHEIMALVIGLPLNMDGSEGPRCQSARQFAANLLGLRDIPVVFVDERLSTVAVTRALLEADASRKRRAQVVDKMAAAYILQAALDRLAPDG